MSECHSCTSSVSVQFQTWPKRVPPAVTRIASMKYTGGEKYFVTEREKERETGRNIERERGSERVGCVHRECREDWKEFNKREIPEIPKSGEQVAVKLCTSK